MCGGERNGTANIIEFISFKFVFVVVVFFRFFSKQNDFIKNLQRNLFFLSPEAEANKRLGMG